MNYFLNPNGYSANNKKIYYKGKIKGWKKAFSCNEIRCSVLWVSIILIQLFVARSDRRFVKFISFPFIFLSQVHLGSRGRKNLPRSVQPRRRTLRQVFIMGQKHTLDYSNKFPRKMNKIATKIESKCHREEYSFFLIVATFFSRSLHYFQPGIALVESTEKYLSSWKLQTHARWKNKLNKTKLLLQSLKILARLVVIIMYIIFVPLHTP